MAVQSCWTPVDKWTPLKGCVHVCPLEGAMDNGWRCPLSVHCPLSSCPPVTAGSRGSGARGCPDRRHVACLGREDGREPDTTGALASLALVEAARPSVVGARIIGCHMGSGRAILPKPDAHTTVPPGATTGARSSRSTKPCVSSSSLPSP
jgi:hypothetical protein